LRSRFHTWVNTCVIWPFQFGLSHTTWLSPVPSLSLQMKSFYYSLWLSNTPLCVHVPHFLNPLIGVGHREQCSTCLSCMLIYTPLVICPTGITGS
jgi:hypothetical protein